MSRDLDDLEPEFREKVVRVQESCDAKGYPMRCYFTLRDPQTQARFWRQSRATKQIDTAKAMLLERGATWLAEILEAVGPQYGRRITGALPGFSWHQHGLAADHFHLDSDGKAEWDPTHSAYYYYTQAAEEEGLTAGARFTNSDAPHIQALSHRVREHFVSYVTLDDLMKDRFGSIAV